MNKLPGTLGLMSPPQRGYVLSPQAEALWDGKNLPISSAGRVINIRGIIGSMGDAARNTAEALQGVLEVMGPGEVVVNINSPGGDMFEGLSMYNLLKDHDGKVVVNVLGLAASAASLIAMAGDEVRLGSSAFLMIHNAQVMSFGNKSDYSQMITRLASFDLAMARLYALRTGIPVEAITKMMDAETWLTDEEAVDAKFADSIIERRGEGKGEDAQEEEPQKEEVLAVPQQVELDRGYALALRAIAAQLNAINTSIEGAHSG